MAYTSYADFAEKLMQTPKPQGNMFTGAFVDSPDSKDYYANPFRKQDSIDEAMKSKKAEEDAAALELLRKQGMLRSGGEGGSLENGSPNTGMTPSQFESARAMAVTNPAMASLMQTLPSVVTPSWMSLFATPYSDMLNMQHERAYMTPQQLADEEAVNRANMEADRGDAPSQADIDAATVSDAAANAAAAATGNYGSITDFGGAGPDVGGGPTGDNGVSGAANEGSHSADGNNSGSESGGFGGGTGDSAGDDGWYKGGKVTKNRLKGMNPTGPDDGYGALQEGEYVISKKAVDKYGIGMLSKINSGKFPKNSK